MQGANSHVLYYPKSIVKIVTGDDTDATVGVNKIHEDSTDLFAVWYCHHDGKSSR